MCDKPTESSEKGCGHGYPAHRVTASIPQRTLASGTHITCPVSNAPPDFHSFPTIPFLPALSARRPILLTCTLTLSNISMSLLCLLLHHTSPSSVTIK